MCDIRDMRDIRDALVTCAHHGQLLPTQMHLFFGFNFSILPKFYFSEESSESDSSLIDPDLASLVSFCDRLGIFLAPCLTVY